MKYLSNQISDELAKSLIKTYSQHGAPIAEILVVVRFYTHKHTLPVSAGKIEIENNRHLCHLDELGKCFFFFIASFYPSNRQI